MSDDSDEWLATQRLAYCKRKIDDFEHRARTTGNLVYVWMAIWEAHSSNLPMPEWCYGQITAWAADIFELAHSVNPELSFGKEDGETEEEFASRVHERFYSKREVSPQEASAMAQHMFRFSSQGWNAFREVDRHERDLAEISKKQARDVMPKEFGNAPKPDRDQGREPRRCRQHARKLQLKPK